MRHYLPLIAIACLLGGCAAVLNPYDEDFYCRATDEQGRCLNVMAAYQLAINTQGDAIKPRVNGQLVDDVLPTDESSPNTAAAGSEDCPNCPKTGPGGGPATATAPATPTKKPPTPREEYLTSRDSRLASLLEQPTTPLLAPPKILRVLILPYGTKGQDYPELYMPRFTYLQVSAPEFILGDYMVPKQ